MTKQEILNLIYESEIDQAIEEMKKALPGDNSVILQSARWNGLQKQIDGGLISNDSANMTKNQIVNALIKMCDKIKEPDSNQGGSNVSGKVSATSENESPKVFISYNHKDKEDANRIKDYFKEKGIPVTIDSEAMKAGEDIKTFINNCIKNTNVTVSLVSTNSLMSAWVGMESVNTLIGEQISNKSFIPCAIETSFFNRSFVQMAVENIDKTLEEIDKAVKWRLENNVGFEDLQNERSRYNDLRSKLPAIVANLKSRLTIDISGDKFQEGMDKVLETINA